MPTRVIFGKLVGTEVLKRSLADPKVLEVNYRTLEGDEFSQALFKKLHEEVNEIGAADSPAEALKELADALNADLYIATLTADPSALEALPGQVLRAHCHA